MNKDILFKAIKKYSEEYLLSHKDEFETMEYGNIREDDYYIAIFNKRFSYKDFEANSKERWIKVIVSNNYIKGMSEDFKFDVFEPYMVQYMDKMVPAEIKLFGDVVIFKLDPYGEFIKKK